MTLRSWGRWLLLCLAMGCTETPGRDDPGAKLVAESVVPGAQVAPSTMFLSSVLSPAKAMEGVFKPRPDTPEWSIEGPIDWRADPFEDPNWRFHLHALRAMDPLILGYVRDEDPAYLRAAFALAMDWVDHHPDAPSPRQTHQHNDSMAWQDMATGLRALRLTWLYRELKDSSGEATPRQLKVLRRSLEEHADILSEPRFFQPGNHGIFVVHGLMAICRTLPDIRDCDEKRAYARARLLETLESQYTPDGGHTEHSPAYHAFVLKTFRAVAATDWYVLEPRHQDILTNAGQVWGWMADAMGQYPNIGDSERQVNPQAAEALPPQAGCEAPGSARLPACYGFKFLPDTGYAVLRTVPNVPEREAGSLFFTCSRFSRNHKHQDDLSFEWLAAGDYIFVDGGKYLYKDDPVRQYMISRLAHNLILFPDEPYAQGEGQGGCIQSADFAEGGLRLVAATPLGKGVIHQRQLELAPGRSLRVTDQLSQRRKQKPFEVRWHLAPGISAQRNDNGWIFERQGQPIADADLDPGCDWAALEPADPSDPTHGFYSEKYGQLSKIVTMTGTCPATVSEVETYIRLRPANGGRDELSAR